MVLATLGVCVDAGFTILTPGCNLKDQTGEPYDHDSCSKHTSTFLMDYKGGQQSINGKVLNLPACDADGEPKGQCYMVTEALFGAIPYGEKISGALFYNFLGKDRTGCTPVNASFGIVEDDENPSTKILLVDRGGCSFVRKVRMAQNAGAAAVIVMNHDFSSKKTVYMGNDGSGDDIKIPSVFVDYETGIALKLALKTWGDNTVRAALSWSIPQTTGKVRWSLWTSAEDKVAKKFKEHFQLAFQKLGAQHQTFTPHFVITEGSKFCLRKGADSRIINICGSACIYNGVYCAVSHDPNLKTNVKGRHIVQENFRQLCIFNVTAAKNRDAATSMWWDYIDQFNEQCDSYSANCSETQMTQVGYTQDDIQNVRDCTGYGTKASKYDYKDGDLTRNSVLEQEIQQQKDDNVFTIPTILINDFPYRGGFKCSKPPNLKTADSCPVLNAVCKAFADEKKPPACDPNFCWYKKDDCGTCLSPEQMKTEMNKMCCNQQPTFTKDQCGDCKDKSDPTRDQCADSPSMKKAAQQAVKDAGFSGAAVGGVVGGFVVFFILIGVAVGAVMYILKKKDEDTRRYVDSVVSSYLPMEDEDGNDDEDAEETSTLTVKEQESTATL